jgi:hypothetical protein
MNPLCHCTQPAVRTTLYCRLRLSLLGRHSWQAKDLLFPKLATQVNQQNVSLFPLW